MYATFFDLEKRPFTPAPRTDCYFAGEAIEQARKTLVRCIERREGPAMVTGPAGTGKTLLSKLLQGYFQGQFTTVELSCGRICTRRALLQAILYGLGLPYDMTDEGQLRLSLVEFLTDHKQCECGMLLLVDEAHSVPMRLLEEIRLLTNLSDDDGSRVSPILFGAPVLEERFASPQMESFNQRIAARCYLEGFSKKETREYIHSQIALVGGAGQELFSEEATGAVADATDGIPRLINQLCDHTLLMAAVGNCHHITAAEVQEAWADLQQLPTPAAQLSTTPTLENPAGATGGGSVIEFGSLDDTFESDSFSSELSEADISMTGDVEEFNEEPEAAFDTEAPEATFDFGESTTEEEAAEFIEDQWPPATTDEQPEPVQEEEQAITPQPEPLETNSFGPLFSTTPEPEVTLEPEVVAETESEPEQFEQTEATSEMEMSSTPEVELVFPETRDPFDEHFEEEELVNDPYVTLEQQLRERAGQDEPIDTFGGELASDKEDDSDTRRASAVLDKVLRLQQKEFDDSPEIFISQEDEEPSQANLDIVYGDEPEEATTLPITEATSAPPDVDTVEPQSDMEKIAHDASEAEERAEKLEMNETIAFEPAPTVSINQESLQEEDRNESLDDRDLIIIEADRQEDPAADAQSQPVPVPARPVRVQRREYGKLFAQLRRTGE